MTVETILNLIRVAKLIGIASSYFSKTVSKPKKYCFWCGKKTRHRVIVPQEFAFITCNDCHLTQPLGGLGEIAVNRGGPTIVELLMITAQSSGPVSRNSVPLGTLVNITNLSHNLEEALKVFSRVFGISEDEIQKARNQGSLELLFGQGISQQQVDGLQQYLHSINADYQITPITVDLQKALAALSSLSSDPRFFDEITSMLWQCFEYISTLISYRDAEEAVNFALLNRVDEYGQTVSARWQKWQHQSLQTYLCKSIKSPSVMPMSKPGRTSLCFSSRNY